MTGANRQFETVGDPGVAVAEGPRKSAGPLATVAVITLGDEPEAGVSVWEAVRACWPLAASPPMPRFGTETGETVAIEGGSAGCHIALVVVGHGAAPEAVLSVADRLSVATLPAVYLLAGDAEPMRQLIGDGDVALPADADPAAVAGALAALASAHPFIRSLRRDLETVERSWGGVHGQLDLLDQEMRLAATVQREFFPHQLPDVRGVDLGVFFRPAGHVSGDIYDARTLDDGRLVLFLADAVGHGVPAALMTIVLARSFNGALKDALERGDEPEPCELLRTLNAELISRQAETPRFATAVCAIADPRERTVTLAGAGHPPPLVLRDGFDPAPIATSGGLLGVFADDTFEARTVHLGAHETLAMYSDGFETAFPADGLDDHERRKPTKRYLSVFAGLAAARNASGVRSAVDQLSHAVDERPGSLHQIDDLSAVLLAWRDSGENAG